ncbi:MAG TPA: MFS transporter [Vicinamibacterales bacterium]|nr:MFS transporter [Vicinamibacterales bacterium]
MGTPALPPAPPPPSVTKKEIAGWCMYDAADSAFTTVIITAFYAPFFSKVIVGDSIRGAYLWGWALSGSEIVVALLAPILGAIADFSGSRKKFLGACAAVIIIFTAALWFVRPGMVGLAIALFIIANVGFAGGNVFIDSFLPGLSNESNAGRLSGLKYGIGYMSGLVAVILAGQFASGIDTPTPELVDRARLIPVVVASYYAVMVIPTFFFLRDRSVPQALPPGENYLSVGFRQLRRTFTQIRRYRELVKLLVAFLVYNDGVVTVIGFAAIYAVDTIGFTSGDILIMFVTLNVVAAAGAIAFGRLADRIGQKRTILISLAIWIVAVTLAYLAHSRTTFWIGAALVGIGMGSTQSVTRSLLALFTPQQNAAEFFGFLGVAGKALAFLGPLVFGVITQATGSQRPAIFAIAAFFIVGMILLSFVDEAKGKAAARTAI